MTVNANINVLLVDDHSENLVALESILGNLGPRLVKAQSGKAALKCLLQQDFAVILLDVQMPDMDGFETAALFRQHPRAQHTPIIFLTAYSDNAALKSKGYKLGAVDYLLKPIDPEILISKVTVFVELFRKNLEVKQQAAQIVAQNLEIMKAQAARQQAETSNRLKDEFLMTVSHELRTPLNAILGWSQLLLTKEFDAETKQRALETIARNAKSQSQLIEDILDMARMTRGKVNLLMQSVDLVLLVVSTLESIRPQIDDKAIQLVAQLPAEPISVLGDAERLRQVMQNLLSNAVKFTPEGGQIEVGLSVQTENLGSSASEWAQITVRDTGIGIEPAFLPHVFDSFQQADSSSTRVHGGLGLGLAIARQLVELHQGTIAATSAGAGKGSTFTVQLPLTEIPVNSEPSLALQANQVKSIDGRHVLVVDDHIDALDFARTVLEQAGATVTAVTSADAAIEVFQRHSPDILISDIAMPEANGYSLISAIREFEQQQGRFTPAIALTAYAKPEDRHKSLAVGFQQHLIKPVEPTQLIETILQLLD